MPDPKPDHIIYEEEMIKRCLGFPQWCADPYDSPSLQNRDGTCEIRIGDVGYFKYGKFIRIISGENSPIASDPDSIERCWIGMPGLVYSNSVHKKSAEAGATSSAIINPAGISGGASFSITCASEQGAILHIQERGATFSYSKTAAEAKLKTYLLENYRSWLREPDFEGLESHDLVLVTGLIKCRNWEAAAFRRETQSYSGELSINVLELADGKVSIDWTPTINSRDVAYGSGHRHSRPQSSSSIGQQRVPSQSASTRLSFGLCCTECHDTPENQTIFIRGFHIREIDFLGIKIAQRIDIKESKSSTAKQLLKEFVSSKKMSQSLPSPTLLGSSDLLIERIEGDYDGASYVSEAQYMHWSFMKLIWRLQSDLYDEIALRSLEIIHADAIIVHDDDVIQFLGGNPKLHRHHRSSGMDDCTGVLVEVGEGTTRYGQSSPHSTTGIEEENEEMSGNMRALELSSKSGSLTPADFGGWGPTRRAGVRRLLQRVMKTNSSQEREYEDLTAKGLAEHGRDPTPPARSQYQSAELFSQPAIPPMFSHQDYGLTQPIKDQSARNSVFPDGDWTGAALRYPVQTLTRKRDAETGREATPPFKGHASGIHSVAFSPDGKRIASGSRDDTIRVWDVETCEETLPPIEDYHVYSVAFSPDGRWIASGSLDGKLRVRDAETGKKTLPPFKGHTSSVLSVVFSPDGKRIASGSNDETIRAILSASIRSPSLQKGKRIASGSSDGTIRVWDAETGEDALPPFKGHASPVASVAFSPDGKRIASGSWDKTIRVWDAGTGGQPLPPIKGHSSSVYSVAFSPNGKRIASGSNDNTIRVWDVETGRETLPPFKGHTNSVNSVAFSPDGKWIASGSEDCTMRVWDAETGREVQSKFS